MTWAEYLFWVAVVSLALWSAAQLYDWIQTRRGVFPAPANTTLDDIRRLRDQGHMGMAIKRFRQLPENKGRYTLRGAQQAVREL